MLVGAGSLGGWTRSLEGGDTEGSLADDGVVEGASVTTGDDGVAVVCGGGPGRLVMWSRLLPSIVLLAARAATSVAPHSRIPIAATRAENAATTASAVGVSRAHDSVPSSEYSDSSVTPGRLTRERFAA